MSPEELQRILELYGLVSKMPGKTASQRLSNLESAGFNLFDQPKQFIPEQFVGTPEPVLSNPIADAYGNSDLWKGIFRDIESRRMSPDEAVQARIDAGVIPEMTEPDMISGSNPFFIAKDYAIKEAENRAAINAWASKNAAEGQQFQATQDRLRAEFEQKQPYGVKDLLGTTEYEQIGSPTVDQLMQVRSNRRGEARAQLPQQMQRATSRSGSLAPPRPVERAARKDIFDQPILGKLLRSGFEGRLSNAARTRVPTDRSQEALRALAMVQLLNQ